MPEKRRRAVSSGCMGLPWPGPPSRLRHEVQRKGVDAIPLAGLSGAVIENVPQVRAAVLARHLDSVHPAGMVISRCDALVYHRPVKGRPARPRIELRA